MTLWGAPNGEIHRGSARTTAIVSRKATELLVKHLENHLAHQVVCRLVRSDQGSWDSLGDTLGTHCPSAHLRNVLAAAQNHPSCFTQHCRLIRTQSWKNAPSVTTIHNRLRSPGERMGLGQGLVSPMPVPLTPSGHPALGADIRVLMVPPVQMSNTPASP
jgi:hypothetical protein